MSAVLNEFLYQSLKRVFRSVRVMYEGEAMVPNPQVEGVYRDKATGEIRLDVEHTGEYYLTNCFAPETLVATPRGDLPIKGLVGQATLLVPNRKGLGSWKEVEVRSFGHQPLLTVHLSRRRARKTIRATPDHRWLVSGRIGLYRQALTAELRPGDRLASCYARSLASYGKKQPHQALIGKLQGFVFGDGGRESENRTPTSLGFYSKEKEKAILPLFAACRATIVRRDGQKVSEIQDLPRGWKELPAADESLSFLYGWLSGYFAADGHVANNGSQASLYSADRDHLNFAKGLCYQLGIRVSPIRRCKRGRGSSGCVPEAHKYPLYVFHFPVRDVPASFWLLAHHASRARRWLLKARAAQRLPWVVEKIEDRGDVDEVFCAVVPGMERFTLADNVLTMNCPFCTDTRKRLYINHMWGKKDHTGRKMYFLAICYNETACLSKPQNQEALVEMLTDMPRYLTEARVKKGKVVHEADRVVALPGPCIPLHTLPMTHKANAYLLSRQLHLGPEQLSRCYGVSYCPESHYLYARDRIVIPIFRGGKLKGWQARYIGELPWKDKTKSAGLPPKYFSCPGMKKSRLIYNSDVMKKYESGVLVEGPTDVFNFGPMSGCIFGNHLGDYQKRIFLASFRKRSGVLLLDPEEMDEKSERYSRVHRRVKEIKRLMPGRFAAVTLPANTDPGSLARDFLRDYVREEAAAQGVRIVWSKHEE